MNFKKYLKESKLKWIEVGENRFVLENYEDIWEVRKTEEGFDISNFRGSDDHDDGAEDPLKSKVFKTKEELFSFCKEYKIPNPPLK